MGSHWDGAALDVRGGIGRGLREVEGERGGIAFSVSCLVLTRADPRGTRGSRGLVGGVGTRYWNGEQRVAQRRLWNPSRAWT